MSFTDRLYTVLQTNILRTKSPYPGKQICTFPTDKRIHCTPISLFSNYCT